MEEFKYFLKVLFLFFNKYIFKYKSININIYKLLKKFIKYNNF